MTTIDPDSEKRIAARIAQRDATVPDGTKVCSDKVCEDAGVAQPVDSFYLNDTTADGRAYYCKRCMARRAAVYRKEHPEKTKEWKQNTVKRNRERNAARRAAKVDNKEGASAPARDSAQDVTTAPRFE